jgi:heptosyltransferase-3
MPEPRSVLLIATRQIGDVLLATPLLRTLRKGYPSARIDVLVYRNKGAMLEGNQDCDQVIEISEHPDWEEYRVILPRLFRKYDLAVNTLAGDRPNLFAFWCASERVGLIADKGSVWKRLMSSRVVQLDNVSTHTVLQNLMLANVLGLESFYEVIAPRTPDGPKQLDAVLPFDYRMTRYAVLHPFPMWRYKRWTENGWKSLIVDLLKQVDQVVLTGGPNREEQEFLYRLVAHASEHVHSLAGYISFAVATELLENSAVYVGPDTAMTHLAAASGAPTVAIYGPSNPVKWGPWPKAWKRTNSWQFLVRPYQQQGNVLLLQGVQPEAREPCVPCAAEGCDGHKESESDCLNQLPVEVVLRFCKSMLLNSSS